MSADRRSPVARSVPWSAARMARTGEPSLPAKLNGCHEQRHGSSVAQAPRIDANDFARGVERRSTGKSRIQGEVERDVLIELSPVLVSALAADAAKDPTARH